MEARFSKASTIGAWCLGSVIVMSLLSCNPNIYFAGDGEQTKTPPGLAATAAIVAETGVPAILPPTLTMISTEALTSTPTSTPSRTLTATFTPIPEPP